MATPEHSDSRDDLILDQLREMRDSVMRMDQKMDQKLDALSQRVDGKVESLGQEMRTNVLALTTQSAQNTAAMSREFMDSQSKLSERVRTVEIQTESVGPKRIGDLENRITVQETKTANYDANKIDIRFYVTTGLSVFSVGMWILNMILHH